MSIDETICVCGNDGYSRCLHGLNIDRRIGGGMLKRQKLSTKWLSLTKGHNLGCLFRWMWLGAHLMDTSLGSGANGPTIVLSSHDGANGRAFMLSSWNGASSGPSVGLSPGAYASTRDREVDVDDLRRRIRTQTPLS